MPASGRPCVGRAATRPTFAPCSAMSRCVLEEVAAATGISPAGLFLAYQAAQHTTAAAANPELDALLAEP